MPFVSAAYIDSLGYIDSDELVLNNVPVGSHPETGDVFLVPDKDRFAGTYALGVQGVGKSGLLENLIAFDVTNDKAVIVIDPHGDLITHCLAQMPANRLHTTYVLDMEDEGYPFGVNIFGAGKLDTNVAQIQAVDRVMHVFEVQWRDVLNQQHLPRYVRAAIITLLANPGSTLVDMQKLFHDDTVRHEMLKNVTEPTVL